MQGATVALLPGDPFRVGKIAEAVQVMHGGEIQQLAWKREYCSWLGHVAGQAVLVTSTGIGGPSASVRRCFSEAVIWDCQLR